MPKPKVAKDDSERWMISYADLLTLMLSFFIVLYSQSRINVSRLKEIAKGLIVAFHGNPAVLMHQGHGGSGILKHQSAPIPKPVPSAMSPHAGSHVSHRLQMRLHALHRAELQLEKVLRPLLQSHKVSLIRHPLSLRIRLNAKILYPSGEAKLTPSATELLNTIASVLVQIPHDYPVVIQGYTNSKAIHTERFPSNWELSTARAVSVVHLFMQQGLPGKQLSAQGFSKYHPLKSDDTPEGLRVNRRVEIVIEAPSAQKVVSQVSLKQASQLATSAPAKPAAPGATSQPAPAPQSPTTSISAPDRHHGEQRQQAGQ